MKKIIMILGYIFLALILVVIAALIGLSVMGKKLDKESRIFVDAAVPAIVSNWDVRELQQRASPEFEASVDYDEVEEYFGSLQDLGTFQEYKGSEGDSNITLSLAGYEITADYTANAEFEAGSAEIQVSLIKRDGRWQILDFKVNPEAFSHRGDVI